MNQEADALSNFNAAGFDPKKRVGTFDASSILMAVIPEMMKTAMTFYKQAVQHHKDDEQQGEIGLPPPKRKRLSLAERSQW